MHAPIYRPYVGRVLSRGCWRTAARASQQGAPRQRCAAPLCQAMIPAVFPAVAHTLVLTCPATTVSTNFRRLNLKRGGGGSRIGAKVRRTRRGRRSVAIVPFLQLIPTLPHLRKQPFPTTHQTKFSRAYKKKNHKNYVGSDKCYKCGGTVRETGVGESAINTTANGLDAQPCDLTAVSLHHAGALGQQVQVNAKCATAHGKCMGMDCRRSRARHR